MAFGISGPEDAVRFLDDNAFLKDPTGRLYSWLVCLGVASPPPASAVPALLRAYESLVRENKRATADDVAIIHCDVTRSVLWFRELASEAGLLDDRLLDCGAAATRILTRLSAGGLRYFQGFDRFVWVSYLVCLQFAAAQNQPNATAEALAFHVSRRLIGRSPIARCARPDAAVHREFDALDFYVERHFPETAARLAAFGHRSIFYALRWKFLWFCDEHSLRGILPLWDGIIAHLDALDVRLFDLAVAHIAQVPSAVDDGMLMLERIQQYRDWDIDKLFADAQKVAPTRIAMENEFRARMETVTKPGRWVSGTAIAWVAGITVIVGLIVLFRRSK
jgi:hypothetical protein